MKHNRFTILMTAAVLSAALLSGCSDPETQQADAVDLAIVSGCHGNAPAPALTSATVSEAILSSAASYGSVSLIVNDGAPFVAADYEINAPAKSLSEAKKHAIAQDQTAQILSILADAKAITPECDALSALTLASRSLGDADGRRCILMMDSGLNTTGYLDFRRGLLCSDSCTDEVISWLEMQKALPDLNGTSVVWVGLGDVSAPQAPLTPANRETLRSIWESTLYAAGAEEVTFADDLPAGEESARDLPAVTPIEIQPDKPMELDFSEPLVLDESKILFLGDSAAYSSRDDAEETLRPVADYLAAHPSFRLLIVGTTATVGSNEDCIALSALRAETVRASLLSMGTDTAQLAEPIGLGYRNRFHVPDLSEDGSLNENAPLNRSVILLDAASEEAADLLGELA